MCVVCSGEGEYHMHIMRCGVRAAIVCDVQLIGRLSLVVVPCVAAVGAATPLWLMRLHKTGDTRKLINVNVPRLRLFISVKPNRAFDNRLEPEYSRNNEHAIERGAEGTKKRQSFNSLLGRKLLLDLCFRIAFCDPSTLHKLTVGRFFVTLYLYQQKLRNEFRWNLVFRIFAYSWVNLVMAVISTALP